MDLKTFASSGLAAQLENGQTRLVSGLNARGVAGFVEQEQRDFPPCTAEHLEAAKRNLREHFAVVGVAERFDETLVLMKRMFGWKHILYAPRNVSRKRQRLTKEPREAREQVSSLNALDMDLFQFAQGLLDEAVEVQDPAFAKELARHRILNRCYGMLPWRVCWAVERTLWARRRRP